VNANAKDKKAGPIRLPLADYKAIGQTKRSPLASIKRFCLDCQGGQKKEVDRCTSVGCDLFFFRAGVNTWTDSEAMAKIVAADEEGSGE
jgi:hypothetical protein